MQELELFAQSLGSDDEVALEVTGGVTDVRPVRERLAAAFGGDQSDWSELVGRHFGRRSNLVHGQSRREVNEADVEGLRDLVQALLELEFGIENVERANRLRNAVGVPTP